MDWVIVVLFAVGGIGIGTIVTVLTTERRASQIDLQGRLLTVLEQLGDPAEGFGTEAVVLDRVPEDELECGIDVVNGDGRVIGTALIPVPARN